MAKKIGIIGPVPEPVLTESRICLGIAYFTSEADATAYGRFVRARGDTYNGGFFHGMACGRESGRDYTHPTLGKLFAVTVR